MRSRRTRLAWVTVALAVVAVAAVACGGSAAPTQGPTSPAVPEPTETIVPSPTPEPTATQAAVPAAADTKETARQEYAVAVRGIQEESDARREEIFAPVNDAPPGPGGLPAIVEAIPEAIEATQVDIAKLEALVVPEEYTADHKRALSFLRDQIEQWRRELEAAEAGDELKLRALRVEGQMLARNMLSDLSESFRDFFLVSEEARQFAQVFGGLSDEESAYLDTVTRGFEEFAKRNAVFGQVLSRQYSDTRVLLEALKGAGAGTAFEAVQVVIAAATPPPRFEADHALLLQSLAEQVRLDREIGKAIEEGDPVHFVVSNIELGNNEATVRAALELSPPVRGISMQGLTFALKEPRPGVLDGGYRESVYTILREFRVRFPEGGPDYQAFNLLPEDAYQVVSRAAPRYITPIETARDRLAALTPPNELTDDHALLTRFFQETLAAQRAVLKASAAQDFRGLRDGMGLTRGVFCETAEALSDEIQPVVDVQFGVPTGPPGSSGTHPMCGPGP